MTLTPEQRNQLDNALDVLAHLVERCPDDLAALPPSRLHQWLSEALANVTAAAASESVERLDWVVIIGPDGSPTGFRPATDEWLAVDEVLTGFHCTAGFLSTLAQSGELTRARTICGLPRYCATEVAMAIATRPRHAPQGR